MSSPTKARDFFRTLKKLYPDASCALTFKTDFQLLVAVVLSAQCTDAKVNQVTPALFKRFPAAPALAKAEIADVETIINSIGLYRTKARNIVQLSKRIVEGGGKVPRTMEELVALPGVGRKTANVVLSVAHGISEGVAVDTHCSRVARRLGLTKETTPEKIERDLMRLYPRRDWGMVTHLFISHGRRTCKAPRPLCEECVLKADCPSYPLLVKKGLVRYV